MEEHKSKELTAEVDLALMEAKVGAKPLKYVWASQRLKRDMVTLTEDLCELSIYAAGEMVLKSHVYSALGAVLYEGRNMIIWVDYPLHVIQEHGRKIETRRSYWDKPLKSRNYNCLEIEDELYGLSPACQEFRMKDDKSLTEYGLYLKKKVFPFQGENWTEEIRYLELDKDIVTQEPAASNIKKWLRMDQEEGSVAEEMMKDMKKRNEQMKKMKETKM